MPDPILGRGKVNAFLFSKFNTVIQSQNAWTQFLRSPEALAFRKAGASIQAGGQQGSTLSANLNELAESFPLRNNFIGSIGENEFKAIDQKSTITPEQFLAPTTFDAKTFPMVYPVCEYIAEEKIPVGLVMGRAVWNYALYKDQKGPKPLPFEFVCHYRLTDTSLKRLKIDAVSLPKTASLQTLQVGATWDFPVIELALTQNPFEKRVGLSEAMWMTGMTPETLQKAILTAAWVSAFIRHKIKKVELNAIKIHLAVGANGEFVLNDNFALDDFYLEREGRMLHPDSALEFYQKTSWIESVAHAKAHAETFGNAEWKRLVAEPAPFLDPKVKARLEADQQELLQCLSE